VEGTRSGGIRLSGSGLAAAPDAVELAPGVAVEAVVRSLQ